MEIIRRDELQELLEVVRVSPYGKFLITGMVLQEVVKLFCKTSLGNY